MKFKCYSCDALVPIPESEKTEGSLTFTLRCPNCGAWSDIVIDLDVRPIAESENK